MPAPRITPDQISQISKLRLASVPVREVAEIVGVNHKTVTKYYNLFLTEQFESARRPLELQQAEAKARHESVIRRSAENHEEARKANDLRSAAAALAIEHRALVQLDKVSGVEAALKIEATVDISAEQARLMARMIKATCEKYGMDEDEQTKFFATMREVQSDEAKKQLNLTS